MGKSQKDELRINRIDPQINNIKGKVMAILNSKNTENLTIE